MIIYGINPMHLELAASKAPTIINYYFYTLGSKDPEG